MGTLLFGVITDPEIKSIEQSKPYVDGFELRLDHFAKIELNELKNLLEKCSLPVMFTVRRKDQGGAFEGTEKERLELIESLCTLNPAYIDLEYDVSIDFRKKLFDAYPKILFLSSYHEFKQTPDDLNALYEKIKTP
jgi:3-dehydroquinate dehydratase / shikimate dehydrogenase